MPLIWAQEEVSIIAIFEYSNIEQEEIRIMSTRGAFLSTTVATAGVGQTRSSKAALDELIAGNRRFVNDIPKYADHLSRRDTLAAGQAPFAIVLSCSDSRVPPEIILDQGLGDMFVVRVAGNYAESGGIGSMQYAVSYFKSAVLLVLGHSSCGAVHATVDNLKAGSPPVPGNIQDVVNAIAPAAESVLHQPGDVYMNATMANVQRTVAKLKNTETIIGAAIKTGNLEVVGCIYDLKTGCINLL